MVLIDDKPMLWHIMHIYGIQGFTDFVIAGGHKMHVIEEWVSHLKTSWNIQVLDTGQEDQTGSRIIKAMAHIGDERCFVTYGDGLGNIDLKKLLQFHVKGSATLTLTAVRPPSRFGVIQSENGVITHFGEKNQADAGWINGGFFVVEPKIRKLNFNKNTSFEADVIPKLVARREVNAFHHKGFWQPMDTLREKHILEEISKKNVPDWLIL
jgi:glucose-1-phosphate cytidylyltransferase